MKFKGSSLKIEGWRFAAMLLLSIFHFAFFVFPLHAEDQQFVITYSGRLTRSDGTAFTDKSRYITFRLYSDAETNECLWARLANVSLGDDGFFSLELHDGLGTEPTDNKGAYANLENALRELEASDAYIGITDAESPGEIRPRMHLEAVPSALRALETAAIDGDLDVAGTLTVSDAAVESMKVSGTLTATETTVGGIIKVADSLRVGSLAADTSARISGDLNAAGQQLVFDNVIYAPEMKTPSVKAKHYVSTSKMNFASNAVITVNGISPGFPVGSIIMWTQSTIPEGWKICDGRDGDTPDLRGRFIVGAGQEYQSGATGGVESVKLALEEMPKHDHTFMYYTAGYVDTMKDGTELVAQAHKSNAHDCETMSNGGNVPHENRPPYYALYFIKRIK